MAISKWLMTKVPERSGNVRKANEILADLRKAETDMHKLLEEMDTAVKQRGKKDGDQSG